VEVKKEITSTFYFEKYLEERIMSYNKETRMYEGYIYCIENLINGKKYIGYTKNDIETRWYQHLSKTHHKEDHSILHLAIDKYKKDNFKIYPIKVLECNTIDELTEQLKFAEKDCIREYNTTTPNGYNILCGGETVPINRITPIFQYTMDGEYIQSFRSLTEAIQINGFDDSPTNGKILTCLRGNHCAFGYLWDRELNDHIKQLYLEYNKNKYRHSNGKRVIQLDMEMNVIKIYLSVTDASRQTGLTYSNIYAVCSPKYTNHHTCGGYLWMFEDDYTNVG
jgi:hypothetical protein